MTADQVTNYMKGNEIHVQMSRFNYFTVLSEITTRNDAHGDAVKTVNRQLKQFSRQKGWKLISHANIIQKGLNKCSLHLNRESNDSLHRNFVNVLRNNN